MKRAMRFGAMIGCFAVSLAQEPAIAQSEQTPHEGPAPRGESENKTDRETAVPTDAQARAPARRSPQEGNRRRLVDRLSHLRALMTEELQLSASQRKSIGDLIDEFERELSSTGASSDGQTGKSEEMKDLRKRIFEARKAGDNAQATALRSQWVQLRYAEIAREQADLAAFLGHVEATLTQTQRRRFPRLVDRAGLRPRAEVLGNTLASLTRTLRHPALELSGEQQATVRRIIREEIQKVPRDERRNRGMDAAVPAIRKRVIEVMTPAQRSRFEVLSKGTEANDAIENEPQNRPAAAPKRVEPGHTGSPPD